MTREEAIKIFNTVLLFGKCDCPKEEIEECLKMTIKALEQEPFINKPCVSEKTCEHDKNVVLDKIRAEIKRVDTVCHASNNHDELIRRNVVLGIIDKYKAESEG